MQTSYLRTIFLSYWGRRCIANLNGIFFFMQIHLNDLELKLVKQLAIQRERITKDIADFINHKVDDSPNLTMINDGLCAEFAFCKLMNIYPDLSLQNYGHIDCYHPDWGTIDVKSTKFADGKLLVGLWKTKFPDAYVLMIDKSPIFDFVGWIESEKMIDDANIEDTGKSKSYVMPQWKLNKP